MGCATAQTGSPNTVSQAGAQVAGKVVSSTGGQVEYWIQYGATTAYGSETPHQTTTVAQNTVTAVQVEISGLARSTAYHYRVCAQDSQQQGGPGCGDDRTLTTQAVGCGETVTADVRLTGDLGCVPGEPGLVIGADGVDVNLAGHDLNGGIAVGGGGPRGIDNSGGFDDLTVRNGTLGAWGFPFWAQDATRNRVLDVTLGAAGTAITIQGGQANEIRNSDAFGRTTGISVTGSDGLVVAGSKASGFFGGGIILSGNLASIVRNQVSGAGGSAQGPGVSVSGDGNRVVDNEVTGFANDIVVVSGAGNVIAENQALQANVIQPPGGDGISVASAPTGTRLRANRADGNQDDGIDVRSASTRLKDNSAFSNGDFGIDAVAGVIDLGGNRAGSNGNPLQCRNVFCQ